MGFDELEDLAFLAEVNAMAFFKISCSSFSRSYFLLQLAQRFQLRSHPASIGALLLTICPSRTCLRQRDSMNG